MRGHPVRHLQVEPHPQVVNGKSHLLARDSTRRVYIRSKQRDRVYDPRENNLHVVILILGKPFYSCLVMPIFGYDKAKTVRAISAG